MRILNSTTAALSLFLCTQLLIPFEFRTIYLITVLFNYIRAAKEYFLRKPTSNNGSATTSPVSSPSPTRTTSGSQIMVEVLDPLNPRRSDVKSGGSLSASSISSSNAPTITLEVPSLYYGGKCLSPIKELPSPLPTPSPSPLPFRQSISGPSGPQSRANSVEEDLST